MNDKSAVGAPPPDGPEPKTDKHPKVGKTRLHKLQKLDEELRHYKKRKAPDDKKQALRALLSRRGGTRATFGLAQAALEDNLRAYLGIEDGNLQSLLAAFEARCRDARPGGRMAAFAGADPSSKPSLPDHALSARLGEALRVYARDVLLSRPGAKGKLSDIVTISIECFTEAEGPAEAGGKADELAWIRAHRGAARALLYWVKLATGADDALFQAADADFQAAPKYNGKPYEWAIRFRAYLYALRGDKKRNDFETARKMLDEVDSPDSILRATLQRSRAMLFSYDAAAADQPADKIQAALAGLEAGADAVSMDPDDCVGAYFTAANWWSLMLAEDDAELCASHAENVQAAIQSARVRSYNMISQALATLVGLRLMESLPLNSLSKVRGTKVGKEAIAELKTLLEAFDRFPPDLETRSIFLRDPIWTTLAQQMPELLVELKKEGIPTFADLAQKFSANLS